MKKLFQKKLLFGISLLTALALAITGCNKGTAPSTATADNDKPKFVNGKLTKEFHLKVPTLQNFNEITIADKKGFFKEVGIILDYTGVINGGLMAQSVINGDNHLFNSGHINTIANARQAGAKLKIVVHSMYDDPSPDKIHMVWLTRDDGKINSAQDFIGKKIALSGLGACAELLNAEYLRQNGVPRDQINLVTMPDIQQEQALRQGLVDIVILHNVFQMSARNHGGLKVLTTSYDIGKAAGNGPASGLAVRAFSEDFIREYPDVVKAYIAADIKSQHWINNHYEEALQIAAEELKMDVKDMAGNVYPQENSIDSEKINFWVHLMELNGFAQPGSINPADLYTNDLNPYYTSELKETL